MSFLDRWHRPLKFALVGVGNSVIDFCVFYAGHEKIGLSIVLANLLAFLVAVTFSYVINSLYTFSRPHQELLNVRKSLLFVLGAILGFIVATAVLLLLAKMMNLYVAKLLAMIVSFCVNYNLSRAILLRG